MKGKFLNKIRSATEHVLEKGGSEKDPVKRTIQVCKSKSDGILSWLIPKKDQVEISEFTYTLKYVSNVCDAFLKTKEDELRPKIVEDGKALEKWLLEYNNLVFEIIKSDKFVAYFTNNRIRNTLDILNVRVYGSIQKMHSDMCQLKNIDKKTNTMSENPLVLFKDINAKNFWEKNFSQDLMVESADFILKIQDFIKLTDEDKSNLNAVLDHSQTGKISVFRFADFLGGFGPFDQCAIKLKQVLDAKYFHGFLSSGEAAKLLENSPLGTYMFRFSKSKIGAFAIAAMNPHTKGIVHTLINSAAPQEGFKIDSDPNAQGKIFKNLDEIISFYKDILKKPFETDITRLSYFHGNLGSPEAESILSTEEIGTFLLRFSSRNGFLAISFVSPTREIKHGLLEIVKTGGYKYDNQPRVLNSIQLVVDTLDHLSKGLSSSHLLSEDRPNQPPPSQQNNSQEPIEHYGAVSQDIKQQIQSTTPARATESSYGEVSVDLKNQTPLPQQKPNTYINVDQEQPNEQNTTKQGSNTYINVDQEQPNDQNTTKEGSINKNTYINVDQEQPNDQNQQMYYNQETYYNQEYYNQQGYEGYDQQYYNQQGYEQQYNQQPNTFDSSNEYMIPTTSEENTKQNIEQNSNEQPENKEPQQSEQYGSVDPKLIKPPE